jgi:phosphoribosyl 1,2-cyclic phosphodiesterase
MKLTVLGSSSKGNCYLLQSETTGETLIVEAGVRMQEVKQALSWQLGKVVGCLCSHRHNDHAGHIGEMMDCGIRVLALQDVFQSHRLEGNHFAIYIQPERGYIVGSYKVYVLPVCHDVPCVGFIIRHEEMGALLFLTDTMMFEYRIPRHVTQIMIEANYADDILEENIAAGRIPASMRERLLNSHMELGTTAEVMRQNDLQDVQNIILLHLSERNSDAVRFRNEIMMASGKTVYVARQGLELELSNFPY